MKLSRKTFLYSIIIAAFMVAFVAGYFVWLLPSLYVDYSMRRNYQTAVELHRGYVKSRALKAAEGMPGTSCMVELPMRGDGLYLANPNFRLRVKVKDRELLAFLEKIRYYAGHPKELENVGEETFDLSMLKEKLLDGRALSEAYPLELHLEYLKNGAEFREAGSRVHSLPDDLIVWEGSVTDGNNYFTSYIVISSTKDTAFLSFLSVVTPQMSEIKPILLESLPMITSVVFLVVLLFSNFFSDKIVRPVIRLAGQVKRSSAAPHWEFEPVRVTGKDEIAQLGGALNELYEKLGESYRELERKNRFLNEENERQEVFLRAASHQLKTPVTAALLLVEGMLNGVGKYRDTQKYLPGVKAQLQGMQKIIEEILALQPCAGIPGQEEVDLNALMEEVLCACEVQIESKRLRIVREGETEPVWTDREILRKMADNLLYNAVQHTPEGRTIRIVFEKRRLRMENEGARIEETLLPNIFEPFVSSNDAQKGRGLGLYVTSYYARLTGFGLSVENFSEGVRAVLTFPEAGPS